MKFQQLSPRTIRVSRFLSQEGDKTEPIEKEIIETNKENLQILLSPEKAPLIDQSSPLIQNVLDKDEIRISTELIGCYVKGAKILFLKLTSEKHDAGANSSIVLSDIDYSFTNHHHHHQTSKKPYKILQKFQISQSEGLFGLGQHQEPFLNWRNHAVSLEQHNIIVSVPILLSTNGYAIVWENLGESHFEELNNVITFSSERAEAINYWVIVGQNFDEIIREIRQLTGKAPMFPKWGYGFIQSRNRYWTRKEVTHVVAKHRMLKLPLDTIVIDYIYYGKNGMGSHQFDEDYYPKPEEMIKEFHSKYHCHVLLSIWPTFAEIADTYNNFRENGYLLDCNAMGGQFYDPFNPKAGQEFWNLLNERLYIKGIDAWWLDASEPDDEVHFRECQTFLGDGLDYLNLYSLFHTKHIFEGQITDHPKSRPFILTRSAFIGQQRHAAGTWSGDILATYEAFRKQIPSGLNFCATGIPYWCTDIGGYKGGWAKNPRYRELFIRWFQFGTFCPIFRSHGRRFPKNRKGKNEIWEYGHKATKIIRTYLNLRSQLVPYIYTLAWKTWSEDYTIMRMLAFDFPDDPNVYNIADQFLFGPYLMICPVIYPNQRKREVYLPKGGWYDYWTNKTFEGGQKILVDAPLEIIPIFVKAGSILVQGPVQQFSSEFPSNEFEVHLYPHLATINGKNNSIQTQLYLDDGCSSNYQNEIYCLLDLTTKPNLIDSSSIDLDIHTIHNHYFPTADVIKFNFEIMTFPTSKKTILYSFSRELGKIKSLEVEEK